MTDKKEILKLIANKKIKELSEIDRKFLKDKEVIKFFVTFNIDKIKFSSSDLKANIDKTVNNIYKIVNSDTKIIDKAVEYVDINKDKKNFNLKSLKKEFGIKSQDDIKKKELEKIKKRKERDKLLLKKETAIIEITRTPSKFKLLPKKLQKDKEIIEEALPRNKKNYIYIHQSLKKDKQYNLKLLKNHDGIFDHFDKTLKKDEDILRVAIEKEPHLIKYATPKLKDNFKVILPVITYNENLFMYASKRIQENRNYILTIMKANPSYNIFYILSKELQNDKDIVIALIRYHPQCYESLSEEMKSDKDVFHIAKLHGHPENIEKTDPEILGNKNYFTKDLLMDILKKENYYDENYEYEYDTFPEFIQNAHPSLLKDEEIFDLVLKRNDVEKKHIEYFHPSLIKKIESKKLYKSFHFDFWIGSPLFPKITMLRQERNHVLDDHNDYYNNNIKRWEDFDSGDLSHINDIFSQIDFKKKSQNKYFQKPSKLPEWGFPSSAGETANEFDREIADSDDEEEINQQHCKYIWFEYEQIIYENIKNTKGEALYLKDREEFYKKTFCTSDYIELQIFYSFITNFFWMIKYNFSLGEDNFILEDIYNDDKKWKDFIYSYFYIVSDSIHKPKDFNKDKLYKLFIKELNQHLQKFKLRLKGMYLDGFIYPEGRGDPGGVGYGFTIEYSGIDNFFKVNRKTSKI